MRRRRRRMGLVLSIAIGVLLSSRSPQILGQRSLAFAAARPRETPAIDVPWYSEIQDIRGINLPHLDDDEHGAGGAFTTGPFVDDPSFLANLKGMKWNLYRLPIVWSRFADDSGDLDTKRIDGALGSGVAHLIANLKAMHDAAPEMGRVVLDLDFHQFMFSGRCGGEGVPVSVVDMSDIGPGDPDCQFEGFQRFWADTSSVQEKWIDFIVYVAKAVSDYSAGNESWLTIALEPINEPWPGDRNGPIASNGLVTFFKFLGLYADQHKQAKEFLVPFYGKFIARIEDEFPIEQAKKYLFIFDPYTLDFLDLRFPLLFNIQLMKGARYSGAHTLLKFPKSGEPATWIAGPHFYGAGSDPWLKHFLPGFFLKMTDHYPNILFHKGQVIARSKEMASEFRKQGMETFIGEVGTYEDLAGKDGRPDGYVHYIRDAKKGFARYTRGFAWWRYAQDDSEAQDAYYLLYGPFSKDHAPKSVYDQRLKCDADNALARLVFDACPAE